MCAMSAAVLSETVGLPRTEAVIAQTLEGGVAAVSVRISSETKRAALVECGL